MILMLIKKQSITITWMQTNNFVCVCFQPYSQAVLLLCDQRTSVEQSQVCVLGGIHCKSLLLVIFYGSEWYIKISQDFFFL